MKMRITSLVVFLFFWSPSIRPQRLYFPPVDNPVWQTKTIAEMGWCQGPVDELLNFLEQNQTKAFILLHNGKIVVEHYFGTHQQNTLWYWASAGKSLVALLTGIAQEKGFLCISDTTSNIIGSGWTSCTPEEEEKITVLHHLTMTSGLDDGVSDNHCTEPGCLLFKANSGTRWAYHNAPYTLLESVLASATNLNLNQIVNNWLKVQTGMTGMFVKQGYNNVFFSNARSMARFGLLVLNNGNWNGANVLSDSDFFSQMVNTSQNLNKSYGYLWWLNGKESHMLPGLQFTINGPLFPDAPQDAIVAAGKNGQFVNVAPSQGIVWIRMGNSPDNLPVPFLLNNQIWQRVNNLTCSTGQNHYHQSTGQTEIFPIPAADVIGIKSTKSIMRIRIANIKGQTVIEHVLDRTSSSGITEVYVKDLMAGSYFAVIYYYSGEVEVKKFLKAL